MIRAVLISIVFLTVVAARAQQPAANTGAAPAQTAPNANGGNLQAPAGAQTSPETGAMAVPTNTFAPAGAAEPEPDTNQLAATNPPSSMPSNNFAGTNMQNPEATAAVALTNRLSTMAPAQAQTVVQVQVGLNVLQQFAVNIGTVQNVQQVVSQNPQAQQQLQQACGRILTLARGPVKPSFDSVDRLSVDLLRTFARARLGREHQLVLAIIINDACNSERLTAAQLDQTINDGLIFLRAAEVPPAFCNSIECDLHSLALEVNPNIGI
jgi:hypothetical protein